MTRPDTMPTVREVVPLLIVRDIGRSRAFYSDLLGFEMQGQWENRGKLAWCRIQRGGAALMLQQAEPEDGPAEGRGHGVHFFFICNDADAFYSELTARNVSVAPPKTAFYGMRQVSLRDPDGYEIYFESPAAQITKIQG